MEKINVRNVYIDLLNKIKNVEGVDKIYVDNLVDVIDQQLTSIESDLNALISVIPEGASATDPLVIDSDLAVVAKSGSYNDLDNTPTIINPVYKEITLLASEWNSELLEIMVEWVGTYNMNIPFTMFLVPITGSSVTAAEKAAFNLITRAHMEWAPNIIRLFVNASSIPTIDIKVGIIVYKNAA